MLTLCLFALSLFSVVESQNTEAIKAPVQINGDRVIQVKGANTPERVLEIVYANEDPKFTLAFFRHGSNVIVAPGCSKPQYAVYPGVVTQTTTGADSFSYDTVKAVFTVPARYSICIKRDGSDKFLQHEGTRYLDMWDDLDLTTALDGRLEWKNKKNQLFRVSTTGAFDGLHRVTSTLQKGDVAAVGTRVIGPGVFSIRFKTSNVDGVQVAMKLGSNDHPVIMAPASANEWTKVSYWLCAHYAIDLKIVATALGGAGTVDLDTATFVSKPEEVTLKGALAIKGDFVSSSPNLTVSYTSHSCPNLKMINIDLYPADCNSSPRHVYYAQSLDTNNIAQLIEGDANPAEMRHTANINIGKSGEYIVCYSKSAGNYVNTHPTSKFLAISQSNINVVLGSVPKWRNTEYRKQNGVNFKVTSVAPPGLAGPYFVRAYLNPSEQAGLSSWLGPAKQQDSPEVEGFLAIKYAASDVATLSVTLGATGDVITRTIGGGEEKGEWREMKIGICLPADTTANIVIAREQAPPSGATGYATEIYIRQIVFTPDKLNACKYGVGIEVEPNAVDVILSEVTDLESSSTGGWIAGITVFALLSLGALAYYKFAYAKGRSVNLSTKGSGYKKTTEEETNGIMPGGGLSDAADTDTDFHDDDHSFD